MKVKGPGSQRPKT